MRIQVLLTALTAVSIAFVQHVEANEPPIRKGYEVSIQSVAKDKKTLKVKIEKEPDVGPNVTTPELFADAVGLDSNRALFIKNPAKFMNTSFFLQKDLELLMPYPESREPSLNSPQKTPKAK